MKLSRETIPTAVSAMLDHRPVRWGVMVCEFDGRERTLEIFDADASEQRELLRRLRPVREQLDEAADGPLVFVFHTRGESRRIYSDVLDAWYRQVLAERIATWIDESADTDPAVDPADIEPLRLRGAA